MLTLDTFQRVVTGGPNAMVAPLTKCARENVRDWYVYTHTVCISLNNV